jgi:hypothetical protein
MITITKLTKVIPSHISAIQRWLGLTKCLSGETFHIVSHRIPQLCSSLFLTTPHLLYLQEQKQRATTFTKRLRKIFDNLEWMFLRGRVLKQVEQASREFPSPGSTELQKTREEKNSDF